MKKPVTDYSKRNVDFSLIHNESDEVYDKVLELMDLKNGHKFLDLGGGYGSFLYKILKHYPDLYMEYHLWDASDIFTKKAVKDHEVYIATHRTSVKTFFTKKDLILQPASENLFDVVLCKMFIHEIPADDKKSSFDKIYKLLKPGGRLYIWKPDLHPENHIFFTSVIAKKDVLAGFKNLAEQRNFILNEELERQLIAAGFDQPQKLFTFDYILHTNRRLSSEFQDQVEKLKQWNQYILDLHPKLDQVDFTPIEADLSNDNVILSFKRVVYSAVK
ncbi:MAG: methyltransferase [Flavobacteriales bacterium]|nr:methyltransferase [Flavobacteriales bacterium]